MLNVIGAIVGLSAIGVWMFGCVVFVVSTHKDMRKYKR